MSDMSDQDWQLALRLSQMRAASATGATEKDFLYAQAESVRQSTIDTYAYVTYLGNEYLGYVSFGALDGDKEKCTVLVQLKDGRWFKLWFWQKDWIPD